MIRTLFIFLTLTLASMAFSQDMTIVISLGGQSYGDYNFSPFTTPQSSGYGNGGGFERAHSIPNEMLLFKPADHPSVVLHKNRLLEQSRQQAAQVNAKVEDIKREINQIISSSYISSSKLVQKYRDLYLKERSFSKEDAENLTDRNLIRGVIKPYELSIINNTVDGLNKYRDQVYGENTSSNERQIIRMSNYQAHAFREARWDMLKKMENSEELKTFQSVEHFEAAEALSRANIHYANTFLNKANPTKEDLIIGNSLLDDAKTICDFALGTVNGVTGTIVDTIKGIPVLAGKTYNALKNYNDTIDQVQRLIEQFDGEKFYSAIGLFFENKWSQFIDGDAYTKGEMIGALSTEIATIFIPGTAVARVVANATKYSIPIFQTITKTRLGEFIISAQKLGLMTSDEVQGAGRFIRNTLGNELGAVGNIETLLTQTGHPALIAYTKATKEMAETGVKISQDANRFLANQARYGENILGRGKNFSQDDIIRIATSYEDLSRNIDKITPTSINSEVWRAVPEIIKDKTGKIIAKNNVETVFDFHKGINLSNGRYSAPGDSALYASMGKKEDAWQTVFEELGDYANQDLILNSKHYKLDKVLDLTNPKTKEILGITKEMITLKEINSMYELTHQLGNTAKSKGYQAIKFPSATLSDGVNLIIFGE